MNAIPIDDLADRWGASRRHLRQLARRLGCYSRIGHAMVLTDADQAALLEATRCSGSTGAAKSGGSEARLPDDGYTEAQALLSGHAPRPGRRASKRGNGTVVTMVPKVS